MVKTADGLTIDEASRQAVETRSKLSWDVFVDRVFELDARLITEGVRPAARPMRITQEINQAAGVVTVISPMTRDPVSDAVHALLRITYGEQLLGMGPIHVGAIMLRDVFVPFYVPGGYGSFRVSPWDFVDKSTANVGLLTHLSPDDAARATDQILDVWDFGWTVDDLRHEKTLSSKLADQARDQIESACMTLQGSFSARIAIQGTAYAVELFSKALLAKAGWSKSTLAELSHNLQRCLTKVCDYYSTIDRELVLHSASYIPYVVKERYAENDQNFSRRLIGDVVGYGQYILGELARAISDRNLRQNSDGTTERSFPVRPC